MFKIFQKNNLSKMFSVKSIIILLVIIVLIWSLYNYSNSKWTVNDLMSDAYVEQPAPKQSVSTPDTNPTDLLPSNSQNSAWGEIKPGEGLSQDLLSGVSGRVGLDTIGNTLKNGTLDIRSDPYIPKNNSAWGGINQSTIEPDLARVPLEIGSGYR
jgi:cytoskeletal protein RodZ